MNYTTDGFEQYQIFVEPKGTHLILNDKWKEKFLLQIKERGLTIKTFIDDNNYHIWGLPFYNEERLKPIFDDEFNKL